VESHGRLRLKQFPLHHFFFPKDEIKIIQMPGMSFANFSYHRSSDQRDGLSRKLN
jgi:hypothetical protein